MTCCSRSRVVLFAAVVTLAFFVFFVDAKTAAHGRVVCAPVRGPLSSLTFQPSGRLLVGGLAMITVSVVP